MSCRWPDACLAAALAAMLAALASQPAHASSRPPFFLRSCVIEPPEPAPLFSPTASPSGATAAAGSTDDEDDEDDTTEDDEDEDDEPPRGFISPGSNACVAISGTVNAGLQRDDFRANALARATGLVPQSATSFPLSTTFRIESGQTLADGQYLASAFEFSFDTNSQGGGDITIGEASVTLGAFAFGLAGSRFDFWTGDEFAFIGRIPSRTVAMIGYERQLTPSTSLSLSAEDTSSGQSSSLPTVGRRLPDGVARLLYENGGLTLHGAVALREVPRIGASSLVGRAVILGATWEGAVLQQTLTVSGQIAGAVNAATYIGSRLDRRVALPLLADDESTRGWSGVVSIGRDWTDEWSSNAYLSRYKLALPRIAGIDSAIRIDRASANLVWSPLDGLRIGLEASLAWQRIELTGRFLAASLNGRQSSAQVFLERVF